MVGDGGAKLLLGGRIALRAYIVGNNDSTELVRGDIAALV